jgi:hypothetical protein
VSETDRRALQALALALHPREPRLEPLAAFGPPEWPGLVALAAGHRVAALLAARLGEAGLLDRLPEPSRMRLRQQVMDDELLRARLERIFGRAAQALDDAGIPFVALKGTALGALVYERPALRPMSDVDLLVPPAARREAVAALGAAGFRQPDDSEIAFWEDAYYNAPVIDPEDETSVEIHWSIAQEGRHRPDVDRMIEASRRVEIAGRSCRVLAETDLLLHQVLHHAYHYFQPHLLWIQDLARLHAARPAVEEVLARARAWGMRLPLALSVAQVDKVHPGLVDPRLLDLPRRLPRARLMLGWWRSADPVEIVRAGHRRRRQLACGLLMLDRPGQVIRTARSWLGRALRHGDRAGHRHLRAARDGHG